MKLPESASTPARAPRLANSHLGPSMNSAQIPCAQSRAGALGSLVACSSPQTAPFGPVLTMLWEALAFRGTERPLQHCKASL